MNKDWITEYEGKEDYRDAMARLVAMHRKIGEKIIPIAKSDKRIEMVILILSVSTAGAFWVVISDALPVFIKWLGAIISTFLTGLTIYQLTIGPKKDLEKINKLYSEFGRSLAHAREYPSNFSWHNFKHLESSYMELGLTTPTKDEIFSARLTGMI